MEHTAKTTRPKWLADKVIAVIEDYHKLCDTFDTPHMLGELPEELNALGKSISYLDSALCRYFVEYL